MTTKDDKRKNVQRIVLIGYRGTGKTTVGKQLANQLGWKYFSTDDMVEEISNMSIKEFVAKFDWRKFREIEISIIQQLKNMKNMIIDCGGGVVENERNMEILKKKSFIVWLDAGILDIEKRLDISLPRPLLSEKTVLDDIKYNYSRRKALYRKYANICVNSSKNSVHKICQTIITKIS